MKTAGPNNFRLCFATLLLWLLLLAATAHELRADCRYRDAAAPAAIERLRLASGEGEGYRMTYCVAVPLDVFWRFKTDFRNDFLAANPQIVAHEFIRREGDIVLTENRYAHDSKRLFRWQTEVYAREHRLDFKLLNPDQAGQKFHFGSIRLKASGRGTMVYQEARFQFAGAGIWAFYPWHGGMRSYLREFVAWEQQAAREREPHYATALRQPGPSAARLQQIVATNGRYLHR